MTEPPLPFRKATLTSVARAAGVSLPTVSKVVNGRPDVADDTRARVEHLLREFNYFGRPYGGRHHVPLSLSLVFDSFVNPYSMEIAREVTSAATHQHVHVRLEVSSLQEAGRTWSDRVLDLQPGGVIAVTSELTERQLGQFQDAEIPLLLIEPVNSYPGCTSVGPSNRDGASAAIQYLVQLGHRRIAAIIGRPESTYGAARLQGYLAALAAANIELNGDWTRTGSFTYERAYGHALDLLDNPRPPTAIFASSDVEALGVLAAARRLQLRVPVDLSVISFDDTLIAGTASPALTAIRQPFPEIGRAAIKAILQMAAGSQRLAGEHIELATTLVIRDSTAAPADLSGGPTE